MSFVSSVLSNQGFTPLPVEVWSPSTDFCGAGRGAFFYLLGDRQGDATPSIIRNQGADMQREMPFLSSAPAPTFAPSELVGACRNRLDAIRLCIQLSRLPLQRVGEELGIDPGHMTRIMQGKAHFQDAKSCDLMRLCGNVAPMQYEAMAMGYQLSQDAKAQRRLN